MKEVQLRKLSLRHQGESTLASAMDAKRCMRKRNNSIQKRKDFFESIPPASFMIMNGMRQAVVIHWEGENSPKVFAKGAFAYASMLRAAARRKDIEIIENPQLARQLFLNVHTGKEVPDDKFGRMCDILTMISQTRGLEYNRHFNIHGKSRGTLTQLRILTTAQKGDFVTLHVGDELKKYLQSGTSLRRNLQNIWSEFQQTFGFNTPLLKLNYDDQLSPNEYAVDVNNKSSSGPVKAGGREASKLIAIHIRKTLHENAISLLTPKILEKEIKKVGLTNPTIVKDILSRRGLKTEYICEVIRSLMSDSIPIHNLSSVLEFLLRQKNYKLPAADMAECFRKDAIAGSNGGK